MALFQIVSDLHLETHPSYGDFKLHLTDARYIALLGDIGHAGNESLYKLFQELVNHYDLVFFLFGNHEPYECTMAAAKSRMRAFESRMLRLSQERTVGRFIFLDQTRYDLSTTVTILGCTLYSRIQDEEKEEVALRFIDFKHTHGWTVEDHNAAHESDLKWLNSEVEKICAEEPQRQIVIFTHHSPTKDERANDSRHRNSSVNSGFVTDLSREPCWTSPNVRVWAYGHTHYNCDFRDSAGKKIITNQKGYYRKLHDASKSFHNNFDDRITYLVPDGKTYTPLASEEDHAIDAARSRSEASRGVKKGWQRIISTLKSKPTG